MILDGPSVARSLFRFKCQGQGQSQGPKMPKIAAHSPIYFKYRPQCANSGMDMLAVPCTADFYGRPLSVSGRPCYILPMFFYIYFFMAALFYGPGYGGSRNFYTWWTLSVNREVTTWIFPGTP